MRQRGFTLIEVLVVLGVGSVLLLSALLTIQQILVNTGRSNSQVVVLDEVHRAALQIKKDLQSHQSANLTDLQSAPTTLSWIDQTGFAPEDDRTHSSTYTLSDTGELARTTTSDNITAILGRHITSLSFTENGENGSIDVVITATSSTFPPRSETLSFRVYKRAEEGQ